MEPSYDGMGWSDAVMDDALVTEDEVCCGAGGSGSGELPEESEFFQKLQRGEILQ